ncbi:MAG: hypothetical protein K9G37_11990 [Crocinitomicaceae bacterium]|nr:hypothetical protein [Crocinitomicaceae bacterium]
MKKILFIALLVFLPIIGNSQTIVAEIDKWDTFECKFTEDYQTIFSDTKLVILGHGNGQNKLTFDLATKTYKFFFLDNEFSNGGMDYSLKDGVYLFTCKTIDRNTNEPMELFVVVNTNILKSNDPYVSQFYSDVNTNKSYGMISYFE